MIDLEGLKAKMDTPEFQAILNAQVERWDWNDKVDENWSNKLGIYTKGNDQLLDEIIYKVINKYKSKPYQDRWYKSGIMPPTPLLFIIHDYISMNGEELGIQGVYRHRGWCSEVMMGQGTVVHVWKEKED